MTGLPGHRDALAAGVASADVVPLPVPHQLVDAVRDGQAHCAAFDDITSPGPGQGGRRRRGDHGRPVPAAGARGAYPRDLAEPFNAALRDLRDSAEWLSIVEPYGLTSANDPPGGRSTEQLCTG